MSDHSSEQHGKVIVGNPSNGGKVPTLKAKAPVKLIRLLNWM